MSSSMAKTKKTPTKKVSQTKKTATKKKAVKKKTSRKKKPRSSANVKKRTRTKVTKKPQNQKPQPTSIFKWFCGFSFLVLAGLGIWLYQLNNEITQLLSHHKSPRSIEFYAAPKTLKVGQFVSAPEMKSYFERLQYRHRKAGQVLRSRDYSWWSSTECATFLERDLPTEGPCLAIHTSKLYVLELAQSGAILEIHVHNTFDKITEAVDQVELEEELFAQYLGDRPILQKRFTLGDTPLACMDAVLAIEDHQFLEHQGISLKGLIRAFYVNIIQGRPAQGASTITQQLIKNTFLTPEKKISRKVKEIFMALIFESRASKDQILETYLNIIYMGQNGPFIVRGFASAAEYYFGRPLEKIGLSECALLAAVLNSPGLFNPFKHPERAQKRKARVLRKMLDGDKITQYEHDQALDQTLPQSPSGSLQEPAPYYLQAVRTELKKLGLDDSRSLVVKTGLNPKAQRVAQQSLVRTLANLEKRKNFKKMDTPLQGLIVGADQKTGIIDVLVGGRNFRNSSYNRVLNAHRQVGSLMKPIVYLTALQSKDENGEPYTPTTLISDEPLTHKYENQSWSPRNFDKKSHGDVPLYWSMTRSLNIATARLGIQLGLPKIIELARNLGVTSTLKPFPSLSLGAFEMTPLEVLQVYTTFANLGEKVSLTTIRSVQSTDGHILYQKEMSKKRVVDEKTMAVLAGMMMETVNGGTAKAAKFWGLREPAAGKTGTTSDEKDAWFAGFTPDYTSIAWTGYDENVPHGLTGASGALPIWVSYITTLQEQGELSRPSEFEWPEGVEVKKIRRYQEAGDLSLIFAKP